MPRVLTEKQLREYRRDGFLAPLEAISPERAASHLAMIEAYEAEIGEDVSKRLRVRAVLALKWLLDLARAPEISGALQDAIGPNVLLFLSGIWSKRPATGKFVSWHQDGAYNPFDRNVGATAWVAFTDSTPERGCIRVIPGSHRPGRAAHEETFDPDNLLSRGQTVVGVDESRAVDMVLRPGQFSIHHEQVVHGSAPNNANVRRLGISLSCVPTEAVPLSGLSSGVLIAGENVPGHWELNREPAFDLDPVGMEELARVQAAYRDPSRTVRATELNI